METPKQKLYSPKKYKKGSDSKLIDTVLGEGRKKKKNEYLGVVAKFANISNENSKKKRKELKTKKLENEYLDTFKGSVLSENSDFLNELSNDGISNHSETIELSSFQKQRESIDQCKKYIAKQSIQSKSQFIKAANINFHHSQFWHLYGPNSEIHEIKNFDNYFDLMLGIDLNYEKNNNDKHFEIQNTSIPFLHPNHILKCAACNENINFTKEQYSSSIYGNFHLTCEI